MQQIREKMDLIDLTIDTKVLDSLGVTMDNSDSPLVLLIPRRSEKPLSRCPLLHGTTLVVSTKSNSSSTKPYSTLPTTPRSPEKFLK